MSPNFSIKFILIFLSLQLCLEIAGDTIGGNTSGTGIAPVIIALCGVGCNYYDIAIKNLSPFIDYF